MKTTRLAILLCISAWLTNPILSQNTACAGVLGPNVFPDGTLGSGQQNILQTNPNIAPGYVYTLSPPPDDGYYCIANSTAGWQSFAELFWLDIGDNSPDPYGYMMVVNADYAPKIFYERTVSVCQNTPYIFSADIINLFLPQFPDAILPNVDFLINGNVVFSTGDIPMDMIWHTYEFALTPSPTATQFTFALRNNAPGGFGNDLALDNISLRFCGPKISLPQVVADCDGTINLQPIFAGNPWQNAFYQWQTSLDGGLIWTNIIGANGQTLNQPTSQSGQQFRLLMSGAAANLNDPFCRAVSNAVLIQTPVSQGFAQQTICQGEGFEVAGQWFSQTGIYQIQLTAANGCDSLLTLDLQVLSNSASTIFTEICEGESFQFGNVSLNATGIYERQISNTVGCDSLISLHLLVHPEASNELFQTICESESYFFDGEMRTLSGDYMASRQTVFGCDSTTILHLQILPALTTNLAVQICEGSGYSFGNQQLATSGTYQQLLQSEDGCDSLVTLELAVAPSIHQQISAQICSGSNFQFGNQNLSITGVYQQNFQTQSGCDSLVTLTLEILPQVTTQLSEEICEGNFFTFGNEQLTDSGNYQQMLETVTGCDSLVMLELSVRPVFSTQIQASICAGETYWFENQPFTLAGNYQHHHQTLAGCDSLVNLELNVLPTETTNLAIQICQGEIFSFGNEQLISTGIYQQNLQTWQGCDSLVALDLQVYPIEFTDNFAEICEGEAYKGQIFTQSNLIIDTLNSITTGCDSIVRTHLTVWPFKSESTAAFRCYGEEYEGQMVFNDTVIVHNGQTYHGCDSITVCHIEVGEKMVANIDAPNVICAIEMAELKTGNFYSYSWSTGETSPKIMAHTAGNYIVTVSTDNGCTKTASHYLMVSEPKLKSELIQPRCHGEENGEIHLAISNGIEPYRISCDGGSFSEEKIMSGLASGLHSIIIIDSVACKITEEVFLPDPPLFEAIARESQTINLGESVQLDALSTLPIVNYSWYPSLNISCEDCPNPIATPFLTADYHLNAISENGCISESDVTITVKKEDDIYIPNAFSPNGDGTNDFFTIYAGRSVKKIKQLMVFDRWGEQVFEIFNATPYDVTTHWHGDFRNMPAQTGVYIWMTEIEYIDGSIKLFKGDVTLMK